MNRKLEKELEDRFTNVKEMFGTYECYKKYFTKALAALEGRKNAGNDLFNKYAPKHLETRFSGTVNRGASVRITLDDKSSLVIVSRRPPSSKSSIKKKEMLDKMAIDFSPVLKKLRTEVIEDQAMLMKYFDDSRTPKRSTKGIKKNGKKGTNSRRR